MRLQLSRVVGYALVSLAAAAPLLGPAAAQDTTRLYLGVDKSHVLELNEPARKVAVANPNIADVQVINPSQLLIVGKTPGVTSLVIFSGKSPHYFDLVIHAAPIGAAGTPPVTQAAHAVLVQRGDKMTEQYFTRDKDQRWLELGQVKPETAEAGKK